MISGTDARIQDRANGQVGRYQACDRPASRFVARCVLAVALCAGAISLPSVHAYQNPMPNVLGLNAPYVLKYNGGYYLYGTTIVPGFGDDFGFRCWYSEDLVNWVPKGWVYLVAPDTWAQYHLWAPEVVYRDGYFYLLFTAQHTEPGAKRICVARATSPLGYFTDYKAPLFEAAGDLIDPNVLLDDDGHCYLYWAVHNGSGTISGQEISADFTTLIGSPVSNLVGSPFSTWEVAQPGDYPVCEAPCIFKNSGTYYLLYSGNVCTSVGYGVGYATGTSPLGPFTKHVGNPILSSSLTLSPPASAPGHNGLTWSPDGSEMFIVYNTLTDPVSANGSEDINIDRFHCTNGVLSVDGPTRSVQPDPSAQASDVSLTIYRDDVFTTGAVQPAGATVGWTVFGANVPDLAFPDYDAANQAYVARVYADATRYRITGLSTGQAEWMPYSAVGSDYYVRAKYYIFTGGQTNLSDFNQIPNLRIRATNRFAVSSILEVFHHLAGDSNKGIAAELRPSSLPTSPSVYRVDFDPVDVSYLVNNGMTEGISRAFEAYSLEPQENGFIGMTESVIGVYPRSALPDSTDPAILLKVFQPTATDAGDLKVMNSATDISVYNLVMGTFEGDPPFPDPTDSPRPSYYEAGLTTSGLPGITMDSAAVLSSRIGIVNREFSPGADRTASSYVRVEEGKQYKIRWHVTSTQNANVNPHFRMRARALKFSWSQKFSVGGSWATGATALNANNRIAQQALPGIGCLNPDKNGAENGGWYTMMFHSPMNADIRPEFEPGTPLSVRMPRITAQPGPGVDSASRRDLRIGCDMLDTDSNGGNKVLEGGNFTVDRIEIRRYDLIDD
jgi:GH43 family beta-xylosidase